ncbi:hypothetical protein SALBM135S_09968 [Streptomyces alboniger]
MFTSVGTIATPPSAKSGMVRVNHYGPDATRGAVHACLAALGAAMGEAGLTVDLEAARRAVTDAWS